MTRLLDFFTALRRADLCPVDLAMIVFHFALFSRRASTSGNKPRLEKISSWPVGDDRLGRCPQLSIRQSRLPRGPAPPTSTAFSRRNGAFCRAADDALLTERRAASTATIVRQQQAAAVYGGDWYYGAHDGKR